MVRDSHRRPADWFPRAIVSGFISTLYMAILFFVAYGIAYIVGGIALNARPGADTFSTWAKALTGNQVLDLAASSVYAAATLHIVIGMTFALLYAYFMEPRLPGNAAVKGMWFALIPWSLSLLVFMPLVGGGFMGANIGAGPLPALGNLLLHLAYGASLGAIYGPLGDIPADNLSRTAPADSPYIVEHYEQTAARGIMAGALVGGVVGVSGAVLQQGQLVFGVPPIIFVPLTCAIGLILGALWGSFSGLSPVAQPAPMSRVYTAR